MADPIDRPAFSNSTEGDAWMSRWCENCAADDDDAGVYCELLSTALLGQTPAQWIPNQPTRLGYQYCCTEFRE